MHCLFLDEHSCFSILLEPADLAAIRISWHEAEWRSRLEGRSECTQREDHPSTLTAYNSCGELEGSDAMSMSHVYCEVSLTELCPEARRGFSPLS